MFFQPSCVDRSRRAAVVISWGPCPLVGDAALLRWGFVYRAHDLQARGTFASFTTHLSSSNETGPRVFGKKNILIAGCMQT